MTRLEQKSSARFDAGSRKGAREEVIVSRLSDLREDDPLVEFLRQFGADCGVVGVVVFMKPRR